MKKDDGLSAEEVRRIEAYVGRLGISNKISDLEFGSSFSVRIETKGVLDDHSKEDIERSSTT